MLIHSIKLLVWLSTYAFWVEIWIKSSCRIHCTVCLCFLPLKMAECKKGKIPTLSPPPSLPRLQHLWLRFVLLTLGHTLWGWFTSGWTDFMEWVPVLLTICLGLPVQECRESRSQVGNRMGTCELEWNGMLFWIIHFDTIVITTSLGPRPKTNPSADRFQYCTRLILEAIYALDEVWGRD